MSWKTLNVHKNGLVKLFSFAENRKTKESFFRNS